MKILIIMILIWKFAVYHIVTQYHLIVLTIFSLLLSPISPRLTVIQRHHHGQLSVWEINIIKCHRNSRISEMGNLNLLAWYRKSWETSASHCDTYRRLENWLLSSWRQRISRRWTSVDCQVDYISSLSRNIPHRSLTSPSTFSGTLSCL